MAWFLKKAKKLFRVNIYLINVYLGRILSASNTNKAKCEMIIKNY